MIVEILGISPQNQGAVLMLQAAAARLRAEFSDVTIAVPITFPAAMRAQMGLWATPTHERPRVDLAPLAELVPGRFTKAARFIPSSKVDVVLDASGFSYGDYWGARTIHRRITRYMEKWKRPGRKLILLPQAFGPFENPGMAEAFREAMSYADLVYARDRKSAGFVEPLVAPDRLRSAHDFTNLLHPELPERLSELTGAAFIIPNYRVVKDMGSERHSAYLRFLSLAAQKLVEQGKRAMILVHEGAGDRALAEDLNSSTGLNLPIVYETEALKTKALIAHAELIISSRFHGLVSALSNGVPSLACGWSHKYLELMSDYGCAQHLVHVDQADVWDEQITRFLADAADPSFLDGLRTAADDEMAATELMWQQIFVEMGTDARRRSPHG